MKDIGLTPHEIDLIRAVFRRFPVIREVALYGSRAKGTYRPESDIDLALIGVDDDVQAEVVADERLESGCGRSRGADRGGVDGRNDDGKGSSFLSKEKSTATSLIREPAGRLKELCSPL